jgi:hypothetical protein
MKKRYINYKRLKTGSMKPIFSDYLFWDCDTEKIDYARRVNFVLERVFSMGTEKDIREAIRYYGVETIKKEIIQIKILDKKTVNYVSFLFKIPKRKFICCKQNVYQNLY